MRDKLYDFYYYQDNNRHGPYILKQIQFLIKSGVVKSNAVIVARSGNEEVEGKLYDFIRTYGWDNEDGVEDLAKSILFWVRGIALGLFFSGVSVFFLNINW